jgi:hypothetical protein
VTIPDFFDDGASNYSEEEWGCDLPWEKLTLEDYIPHTGLPLQLEQIKLDVIDLRADVHHRIVENRWDGHRIVTSWNNLSAKASPDHIILEICESTNDLHHILRCNFVDGRPEIYSHNLHSPHGIERSYSLPLVE